MRHKQGANSGAEKYITKPFDAEALIDEIEMLLHHVEEEPARITFLLTRVLILGRAV